MRTLVNKYFLSFSNLPKSIWILTGASAINSLGKMAITFLFLHLTTQLGEPVSSAGKMMALYGVGSIFGALLSGYLCGKFDSRKILVFSLLGSGLSILLLGMADSVLVISALIALIGFTDSTFRPSYNVSIGRLSKPEDRGRVFSLYITATNLTISFAGAVGGLLMSYGFKYLCLIDGLSSLAASFFLIFYLSKMTLLKTSENITENPITKGKPWKDPYFLQIYLVMTFVAFVFFQINSSYPLYLKEFYGLGPSVFGILLGINGFLIVAFGVPCMAYSKRYLPENVAALGAIALCGGFGLLGFGNHFFLVVLSLLSWTFGEMILFPTIMSIILTKTPEKSRGAYLGLYHAIFSLSHITAPLVGTWIYGQWGGTALMTCFGIIGLLAFFSLRNRHRPSPILTID